MKDSCTVLFGVILINVWPLSYALKATYEQSRLCSERVETAFAWPTACAVKRLLIRDNCDAHN